MVKKLILGLMLTFVLASNSYAQLDRNFIGGDRNFIGGQRNFIGGQRTLIGGDRTLVDRAPIDTSNAVAVPEPPAWLILSGGVLLLILINRLRQVNKKAVE